MTDMAGVIAASPYTSAAPNRATNMMRGFRPQSILRRSAINARMPPSPLLSTRNAMVTYFTDVTIISVHRISDNEPRIAAGSERPVAAITVLNVYRGLVPMSPNTTPRAARLNAGRLAGERAEGGDSIVWLDMVAARPFHPCTKAHVRHCVSTVTKGFPEIDYALLSLIRLRDLSHDASASVPSRATAGLIVVRATHTPLTRVLTLSHAQK